jgi:hypothetical protein
MVAVAWIPIFLDLPLWVIHDLVGLPRHVWNSPEPDGQAGLLMSIDQGRPEVSVIRSNRRDQPLRDVGRLPATSATVRGQVRGDLRAALIPTP